MESRIPPRVAISSTDNLESRIQDYLRLLCKGMGRSLIPLLRVFFFKLCGIMFKQMNAEVMQGQLPRRY